MQQDLIGNQQPQKPRSLAIAKKGKHKLSKNQEAFNRLTQKIEKLQKEIEKKQIQFDVALGIYSKEYYPAQLKMLENRQKLIIVLFGIYKKNKLSKPNQRHLKEVLQFHLQEYFEQSDTEPGKELQLIFSELENISYDKMMEQEEEQMKAHLEEMLEKMNVDIAGIDLKDEAAITAKIAEARHKMEAMQEENNERERKRNIKKSKTAKQIEVDKIQQAVKENKQKNISTIYKQLAKLFHPDLEQDTDRKVEKEILMKELTKAYEAKNLHALLMLELKWIHKENDHLESLTDDKLAIYLQILKEQAMDLEHEKNTIIQQPQYSVLLSQFGFQLQKYPVEMVKEQVKNVLEETLNFESDIKDFESDMALRFVNEMIKQWKNREEDLDEEEILRMLFG
jgi:hypothetical protein